MNNVISSLVDNSIQCWGCPVFDKLFQIVSTSAAAVYHQFSVLCMVIFAVLFGFTMVHIIWKNVRGNGADFMYQKSIQPLIINSLIALSLLGMGVTLPRFLTTITFEPTAKVAQIYTQNMIQMDEETINQKVTYQPEPMADDGFYRPQLRDTIIVLMKTTITQFQSYIKLGIAVMESAVTWKALLGVGALLKHIMLFIVGAYLFYAFFKLFFRFCFYFADIIVAMTFFSFFFPLSLMLMSFKGVDTPSWMSGLGKGAGTDQFKKLINAIITLAAAVLTYTVIMVIIAKFFSASGTSADELAIMIAQGNVFDAELSEDTLETITMGRAIVLVYVLNYIYTQIPKVTQMVLSAFNVSEEKALSEQLANDAMKLTGLVVDTAKKTGKIIMSGGREETR